MLRQLANAVLFQLGWFACALGGNSYWLLSVAAIVLIHLRWLGSWAKDGKLLIAVTVFGTLLDSLLSMLGVFAFPSGSALIPLWLMLMWSLLAITLNHCLAWSAKPWWRASLLGAIAAPLSYSAGAQLAGVQLPLGRWQSLILLGLIWAVVFPALHWLASYLRNNASQRSLDRHHH
jgi:hypothetical protein